MRTLNSTKSIIASLVGQVLGLIITFISRTIFVKVLNVELLGVEGLFSNIFSILALTEMGFAMAVTYSLYKPLAEQDIPKINGLLNFFRVIYKKIGLLSFVLGIILLPFLNTIIKSETPIKYIQLYYFIFSLNNVVIYFFSYKKFILIADQKNYVVVILHYLFFFIFKVAQVISLFLFKNYAIYLSLNVIALLAENLSVSFFVDRNYTFLKNFKNYSIEKITQSELLKNVHALAYHKIGSVLSTGADAILISTFVGIASVGIYSNYILIIQALNLFLGQLFGNVTASIGNLIIKDNNEKTKNLFYSILLADFWIFGLSSILFFTLSQDFITIWLGKTYLLSEITGLFLTINYFLQGTRKTSLIFKDAFGLFWYDRYKPIAEVVIKIGVSLLLLENMKINGVLIGSMVSVVLTCLWVEPFVVFKFGFHKDLKMYFFKYIYYLAIHSLAFLLIYLLTSNLSFPTVWNILAKIIITMVIYNGVMYFSNKNRKEYTELMMLIKKALYYLQSLFTVYRTSM